MTRVVLKPESGQGDPGGYVLVGSSADVRAVLEYLLAAVMRSERPTHESGPLGHAVMVGDATSRYEYTHVGVRIDPDVSRHRKNTRWLWRLYDGQLAGLIAPVILLLAIVLLAIVGAGTVWRWLVGT